MRRSQSKLVAFLTECEVPDFCMIPQRYFGVWSVMILYKQRSPHLKTPNNFQSFSLGERTGRY